MTTADVSTERRTEAVALALFLLVVGAFPGAILLARRARGRRRQAALALVPTCVAMTLLATPNAGLLSGIASLESVHSSREGDAAGLAAQLHDQRALVFVPQLLTAQMLRRLGGLGVPASDAAKPRFDPSSPAVVSPDPEFHTNGAAADAPCLAAILHASRRGRVIPYGVFLLENSFDTGGHIAGPLVFVNDLGVHNEALRARFSDRPWYRLHASDTGGALGLDRYGSLP